MFGDNDYEEWADFLQEYSPPPYSLPGHTPALSFGVAGPGSGVPFHTHGYNTTATNYLAILNQLVQDIFTQAGLRGDYLRSEAMVPDSPRRSA